MGSGRTSVPTNSKAYTLFTADKGLEKCNWQNRLGLISAHEGHGFPRPVDSFVTFPLSLYWAISHLRSLLTLPFGDIGYLQSLLH